MKSLTRRQITKKLESLRPFARGAQGVPSWIRYMRKALGMTPGQLAYRMGVAEPSLYQLERKEKEDKINLQSLKKAAEAMNCEFVYAFIPRRSIDEIIDEQAYKKAKAIVQSSHLQMEYEDQAVTKEELKAQIEELIKALKESKTLWE